MIKAIIFDFDGVIVDSECQKFNTLKKLLKKEHIVLQEKEFKNMLGKKTDLFLRETFPKLSIDVIAKIIALRREQQSKEIQQTTLIPGIRSLLNTLKKKYRLAISTGSPQEVVMPILKRNNLDSYFAVFVTGEQFKTSKPNAECYTLTLKKLKIKPSEAIIIEDSGAGITAGKSAGCKVFALKNKYNRLQITRADKVFNNHKELAAYSKMQLH